MHVTFSEIASARAGLSTAEAVGLVLAAMRAGEQASGAGHCAGLPDADHILLSSGGVVSFSTRSQAAPATDRVKQIAALLHRLLALDERASGDRAGVPGALLLAVARASGQIDLPAPSYAALRDVLIRFGSPAAAALAPVHARIAADRFSSPRPAVAPERAAASWPAAAPQPAAAPPPARRRRHVLVTPAHAALAAALPAAAFALAFALTLDRPGTGTPATRDAVTIETVDQPVTIEAPAAVPPPPVNGDQPPAAGMRVSIGPVLSSALLGDDVFSPSFTPEGGALMFHSGRDRSALMRASFDGTKGPSIATVLRDGAANYHVTVSPDGTWLAYDSDRDGMRGVYVARADASEPRKISGDGFAAVPRWSPDGRRIAFIKAEAGRPRVWNVWVADLHAGTVSRVSRHGVGQAWGASWFPDGNRIAYSVEDRLVLASLDGGTVRIVPSPRRGRLVRTPAVSPDGRRIVFQVHRDGAWLLEVASGDMRRVLSDTAAEEFAWSPDSRRVVYHTRRNGAWSVWQLELDPATAG
jgi:Tol biopolymer transport system component